MAEPTKRRDHESAQIGDRIYVFGGFDGKKWFSREKVDVFNTKLGTWDHKTASGPNIPPPCRGARCVVINGFIYSYGGWRQGRQKYLSEVYCLDPNEMKWELVDTNGARPIARHDCCLHVVGSRVIMYGGFPYDDKLYELKLHERKKGEWVEVKAEGTGPGARWGAAMAEIDDCRALVHGGQGVHSDFNDFFVIDLEKKKWSEITLNPCPSARAFHTLSRLKKKGLKKKSCFILIGGKRDRISDHCYIIDIEANKTYKLTVFKSTHYHTAHTTENPDGAEEVFLFGRFGSRGYTSLRLGPSNKEYARIESRILSEATAAASLAAEEAEAKKENSQNSQQREEPIRSQEDQLAYERALKSGSIKVERMRLMFVGQDGSGKTSLIRSLLGKPFQETSSTDGVAIDVAITDAEKWQDQKDSDRSFLDKCLELEILLAKSMEQSSMMQMFSSEEVASPDESMPLDAIPVSHSTDDRTAEVPAEAAKDKTKKEETSLLLLSEPVQFDELLSPKFAELLELSEQQMKAIYQYVTKAKELSERKNLQILHLWDLGGHEIYLSTHCSLLPSTTSRNSLTAYVLVVNLSLRLSSPATSSFKELDGTSTNCTEDLKWVEKNADFVRVWLSNLCTTYSSAVSLPTAPHLGESEETFSPPVFIAGTHFDHFDLQVPKDKDELKERNQSVADIVGDKHYEVHVVPPGDDLLFLVDNTKPSDCLGVKSLRERIDKMKETYFSKKEPQPFRWILLEFLASFLKKNDPIVKRKFLLELAIRLCGLADKREVTLALNHLDSLGIILLFPGVASLEEEVFIDPEWVVKMLAVFVTAKKPAPKLRPVWRLVQNTGRMGRELANARLAHAGVPKEKTEVVMALLHHLNITSPASASDSGEKGDLFIPCLLTSKFTECTLYQQSDPSSPFPPPLVLIPQKVDTVPEALFFRLVARFLRHYKSGEKQLSRHRYLLDTKFFQIEVLYADRGRALVVTVGGDPDILEESPWVCEVENLRQFFEKQIGEVINPGMQGFSYYTGYYLGNAKQESEKCTVAMDLVYALQEKFDKSSKSLPWLANKKSGRPKKEWAYKVRLWFGSKPEEEACIAVTPAEIRVVCEHNMEHWKQLGFALDFDRSQLYLIEEKQKDSYERVLAMVYAWRDKHGREATLDKLLDACGKDHVRTRGVVEMELKKLKKQNP